MPKENYKNPYYNLTTFLDSILDYHYSNNRNINYYVDINKLIKNYKKKLNYYSQSQELIKITKSIFSSNANIFEKVISFENNNFYKMFWNIDNAKAHFKSFQAETYNVKISDIIADVKNQKISIEVLSHAYQNKTPIIIALYPPLSDLPLVIDGNHRILSRYLKRENSVKAYILEPKSHLQFTTHEIFRLLYTIHYNSTIIFQYVNGAGDESFLNNLIDF